MPRGAYSRAFPGSSNDGAVRRMDSTTTLLAEWRRFAALLTNPRAHPQQAVVAYAIVAVGVLLILVIVGLLTVRTPAPPGDSGSQHQQKSGTLRHMLMAIESIFVGAIILIVAFGVGISFPQACGKCHTGQEHVDTWRASTHRAVGCRRCHWQPGPIGLIQAEADVVRMARVWASSQNAVAGGSSGVSVPNGACKSCHRGVVRKTTEGRIRVSHRELADAGYACTACHAKTGHAPRGDTRPMTMDLCLECHDGKRAPKRCDYCHPSGGFGPEKGITAEDYPRVQISRRDCEGCHSTKPCTKCHGVYLPHSFPYAQGGGHAREAFAQPDLCLSRCHTTSNCRKCHSRVSGHGPNWKTTHGESGTAFCNIACHHQAYVAHLPGVTPSATFCDNCHKGPLPPPRGGDGAP